ncbi:MAG: glutamate-5-semialdehyde dehydrogenase [Muribaculaceae bacterium]|nr:glutamate-5-semialdehyde dehydrogenase [Muribaculaceae bacterium]
MESIRDLLISARRASRAINTLDTATKNKVLADVADAVEKYIPVLLTANSLDLARMDRTDPKYDRLQLTEARLRGIAGDMRAVAALPSPLGVTLSEAVRPNGMVIRKVSVPFGVIGIIYEARPNVTFDVFSLCFKAGSACLLKGGGDAADTNAAAVAIIRQVLIDNDIDPCSVTLLPSSHDATAEMMRSPEYVDLIIPRGGRNLIDFVRRHSLVPVIETGAGVCHTYVHSSGRLDIARDIVLNAKTRRVSVCNALDSLVIDRSRLSDLAAICEPLAEHEVEIFADAEAYEALRGAYPRLKRASAEDFGREWLDYKMSIATVANLDDAIRFISDRTSHHSEAIVATDAEAIARFQREIDAACVYANVSTAFTDGGQFGFGAEIGISTQKLHARGPMALPEITTYKYLITGDGQTRKS